VTGSSRYSFWLANNHGFSTYPARHWRTSIGSSAALGSTRMRRVSKRCGGKVLTNLSSAVQHVVDPRGEVVLDIDTPRLENIIWHSGR